MYAPAVESGGGDYYFDTYFEATPLNIEARCAVVEQRLEPFFGDIVESIQVSGNTHTKRVTITREMATKEGEPLDRDLIRRDTTFLRGLGFFSDVDISAARSDYGKVRIQVSVIERPGLFMRYPYPVVNYHLVRGVSYGVKWRIKNFRGLGEEFRFHVEKLRDREHGGSISWAAPWVGGRRMRMYAGVYNYRRLEDTADDFIKEKNGGTISIGLPLSESIVRQIWLLPSIAFEERQTKLVPHWTDQPVERRYYRQNMLTVGLRLEYDSRDSYIVPLQGLHAGVGVHGTASVHGLKQQYAFSSIFAHWYIPLRSAGTLILAVDGHLNRGDLPGFYELGLGGKSDLRGLEDSNIRGNTKFLGTLQWRRQFFGPILFDIPVVGKFDLAMNAVAFVDHGVLENSFGEITGSGFITTGGFGLEFVSPIQDIVRVEMAFNEFGGSVVYFTSGSRF